VVTSPLASVKLVSMGFDVAAAVVVVVFALALWRIARQQRKLDPLRAEAAEKPVLFRSRVAVKTRFPGASLWSGHNWWWSTKTLGFMELVVYPGIVGARTSGGAGRLLGSDWWFRSPETTMSWVTIIGREWLALSGRDARGLVDLALSCADIEAARAALAESGVRPL
jgi:hypothetical protein